MISSYGISPQFIFGVRADIREGLFFWDERKVIYVAGHNVVDYNFEENQQKFYSPMEGSTAITALTLSPQRALMAFAESQPGKGPIIHIYDKTQRKRRSLSPTTIKATRALAIAFATTKEERNILVLYGPPEYALIYWRWDSSTCEATLALETPVEFAKCSFSPADPMTCVLTGQKTFLFMKIEPPENKSDSLAFKVNFKEIKGKDNSAPEHSHDYMSHCWTNDAALVVGTDQGELLILDSAGQFLSMTKLPGRVECLTAYSRGVLAGCAGPTIFALEFTREDAAEPLRVLEKYSVGAPGDSLTSIAIKPNVERSVFCITASKQLLKLDMINKKWEELISSFHSKGIIGLDVCVRKPLVVTCSEDNTIRLWNFVERKLEFSFSSNDITPQSVAFHPSGLHIVVGCPDKVYVMNVFLKTLKASQDIGVKQFKEVSFSHGGHLLAVSHTNTLQVFNFYTMEPLPSLPMTSGKIQAIEWYEDDTGFVTSDQNNYVSFCGLDSAPLNVHVANKVTVSSVVKVPDSPLVLAACSDMTIKEVTKEAVSKKLELKANPSQIAMTRNQKLFFVGIGDARVPGSVKYFKCPLSEGDCTEIQAHSEEIRRMRISWDDKYLFTAGKDGCVIVYDIKEKERTREGKDLALAYSDEILTDKPELNEISQKLDDARNKNKELTTQKGITQDSELNSLTQKIDRVMKNKKENSEKYAEDSARAQNELSQLKSQQEAERKSNKQKDLDEQDRLKREHLEAQSQRATEYSKRSLERDKMQQEDQQRKDRHIAEYSEEIAKLQALHQQEREKRKAEVEQKRKERDTNSNNQRQIITQINEDNETEVAMMREEHKTQLQKKNEQLVKLRGDHQVNQNKIEEANRKISELTRDIRELEEALKKAEEEEAALTKKNQERLADLDAKSKEIAKQETSIYQHKKDAQELEKFKFVLDYKIKELKREINPRELQIEALKDKTTAMDKKLKKFNKLNVFLGYRLKELQTTQETLQKEITNNREKLRKNAIYIKERLDALDFCVQFIHYPAKLRAAVEEKLARYKKDGEQAKDSGSTISHEFDNQEEFMKRAVEALESELGDSKKTRKESNKQIRDKNKLLIDEIRALREQIAEVAGPAANRPQKTYMKSTRLSVPSSKSKGRPQTEPRNLVQDTEQNKQTILMLRAKITELRKENEDLKAAKKLPA